MQRYTLCALTATAATFAGLATSVTPGPSELACRIDPSGNTSGPSADICDQVVRRWRGLMSGAPTPGEIRLIQRGAPNSTDNGPHWTLEWPAPLASAPSVQKRKRDGLTAHLAENILPHEAGHHVLKTYLGLSTRAPDGYGSPAPDWIDEAAAVWMESRAAREQRMRGLGNSQPSLEKIALMGHPMRNEIRDDMLGNTAHVERTITPPCPACKSLPERMRTKYTIVTTTISAGGSTKTVVSYADADPNASETFEQRNFYPLAYSLLRFVRERGGVSAVIELMGRYRDNPAPRVAALLGLPGLPNTASAFEAAWRDFLRNPPPESP
jgi:hypothetical protein